MTDLLTGACRSQNTSRKDLIINKFWAIPCELDGIAGDKIKK